MKTVERSGVRWLWLSIIVIIVDQLTKYWTVQALDLYQSYPVLSFFNFTYARNYGAAFSFLDDSTLEWQKYLFSGIAVVVSLYLIYLLKKTSYLKRCRNIAFALIVAGAIGNVTDRLIFGFVIDFLDFDLGFYRWPTFNVADISIFIGAALIILESFLAKEDDKDSQ